MFKIKYIFLFGIIACGSVNNSGLNVSVGGQNNLIYGGSLASGGETATIIGETSSIKFSGGTVSFGGNSENISGNSSITMTVISSDGGSYSSNNTIIYTGEGSIDVNPTSGGSNDISQGGSGTSIDILGTGGLSIDVAPSGGGSSIDLNPGTGGTKDVPVGGGSNLDLLGGGSSLDAVGGSPSLDLGCKDSPLNEINVYVIADSSPTGADSESRMYVGGNFTSSNYAIGQKDLIDCTKYALVVRGNVTGALVYGGSSIAGGAVANSTNQDCGWASRGTILPIDFDQLQAQVESLSSSLSQLSTNGTISGSLTLTGKDPTLNIFNITADQMNTTTINVNFPAGSSVIINVSGTIINFYSGSICLNGQCSDSEQANFVLWNLYQANSATIGGIAVEGSVLAPYATIEESSGGHLAGQLIIKYLKGGTEYHPYYFQGCLEY